MNFIRINIINNEMQVCGFMGYEIANIAHTQKIIK